MPALGEDDDAAERAGREVDAERAELPQQGGLGDVDVVVLGEAVGAEFGAFVAAGPDVLGQGGDQGAAVGGEPAPAALAGGLDAEVELPDDEVVMALAGRADGRLGDGEDDLAVAGEEGVLGSLVGAGSFLGGCLGLGRRLFEGAGSALGTRGEALELGDLVFERLAALAEEVNHLEEAHDERCTSVRRDFGDLDLHTRMIRGRSGGAAASPGVIEQLLASYLRLVKATP